MREMSKNLDHHAWVNQQFEEKYLEAAYRNVIIHSSIIEGVLVNESRMDKFDSANKFLLSSQKIDSSEFCILNEIRKIRNRLMHDILQKNLAQKNIDKLRDDLMEKIHDAYKVSLFLDEKLFKKYKIKRLSSITFDPAHK